MKLLVLLIGMVMILEGLPYVAAPEKMREWLEKLSQLEPSFLRIIGLVSMGLGLFICWLAQGNSLFS